MTLKKLFTLLKSIGYPLAYIKFKQAPTVPFIVYLINSEEQSGSDDKNMICTRSIEVQLYTEYNDTSAEIKLDKLLSFTKFEKDRVQIEQEKLLMIAYTFDDVSRI